MSRSPLVAATFAASALIAAPAFADPVRIVAAENFYGDVARQIGGDDVAVTSILSSPDQDPHLFEASAEGEGARRPEDRHRQRRRLRSVDGEAA
jgi:zinc/manganese transport system substrate-binding protein